MTVERIKNGWKFQLGDMPQAAQTHDAEFEGFIHDARCKIAEDKEGDCEPPNGEDVMTDNIAKELVNILRCHSEVGGALASIRYQSRTGPEMLMTRQALEGSHLGCVREILAILSAHGLAKFVVSNEALFGVLQA